MIVCHLTQKSQRCSDFSIRSTCTSSANFNFDHDGTYLHVGHRSLRSGCRSNQLILSRDETCIMHSMHLGDHMVMMLVSLQFDMILILFAQIRCLVHCMQMGLTCTVCICMTCRLVILLTIGLDAIF